MTVTSPWLTIATVVKDDPDGLRATAASVASQSLDGVQFLVVDGSADRGASPAVLAAPDLAEVQGCLQYLWAAPQGIYTAMNSALSSAAGDYILFLNAGDTLASPGVIAAVREVLLGSGAEWAYGPVEIAELNGTVVITPPWDFKAEQRRCFARGHFPCHQGTFARVEALRRHGGFDTSYTIAADYASFLHLATTSPPVVLDVVIARFVEGGASTQHWARSFAEFHRARRSILRPRGASAAREYALTGLQFAKVGAYRGLIQRWRTP